MPWRFMKSFAKALELSSCAAFCVGPKMRRPRARNSSTTPAARGASGPTTVNVTLLAWAKSARAFTSVMGTLTRRASRAVPPLPGATYTLEALGDWASFQARACSRPPEPMTRMFIPGPVLSIHSIQFGVVIDLLDIVQVFQHIQQLLHAHGIVTRQFDGGVRAHGHFGHLSVQTGALQGILDRFKIDRA